MDLGCLDLGCISVSDKCSTEYNTDSTENVNSATKTGKSKSPKGAGQSTLNALNKFTSQIKKPSHRKNSPINWFPRKKVDSYLKRKIKMLQEIDGMNLTLDETLGDSNPHYSRVLREKIAAREAAQAAMEARKAALVEASWCKILRAARIQSKEAEELLVKAEKTAAEAFEEATALGVIMFDKPNHPFKTSEIETTHTVTASFETAFEVDKEVAAAVRTAFIRFASSSCFNKEEFKELLCKISQNPNVDDNKKPEQSEYELEPGSESLESLNFTKLVDMMLERLGCLKEEELSSLATIVATCGLSAALAEEENGNAPRRMSTVGSANSNLDPTRRKQAESELPSLDKFLVKHMSKLEREVLEAKNSRKSVENSRKSFELFQKNQGRNSNVTVSDLGSILVKHSSKLEKAMEAEKKNPRKSFELSKKKVITDSSDAIPSLESVLTKHSSKLEKEVQETRNNTEKTRKTDGNENRKTENVSELPSLDKFLVKHVSRLEKEVQEAKNRRNNASTMSIKDKENIDKNTECDQSLDKVLVKHVSRLEKAKMEFKPNEERVKEKNISNRNRQLVHEEGSLDQILVKHKSKLERAKLSFHMEQEGENRKSVSRREAREKELQEAWGGLGLGNSIKPHISRLERDKAAWIKAEEEQRRNNVDDV